MPDITVGDTVVQFRGGWRRRDLLRVVSILDGVANVYAYAAGRYQNVLLRELRVYK